MCHHFLLNGLGLAGLSEKLAATVGQILQAQSAELAMQQLVYFCKLSLKN